ncbi:MAG: ureidoglycolate lyase [Actinobacteria bacterium]|nr:ureidoglycolate lyase [Actinomycetota bacterium]
MVAPDSSKKESRSAVVEPLTPGAFAPFGRVIDLPARPEDAAGPGWCWWAELDLLPTDGRAFGIGYLALEHGPTSFDWAERHLRTVEVVIPLTGAMGVYAREPGDLDTDARFHVFRVEPGAAVVLDPGVWHGAPLALGGPARGIVLILERTGATDVDLVRFEDAPVSVIP